MKKGTLPVLVVLLFQLAVLAQTGDRDREWNKTVEPFRMIGNVYYVGAAEVTSFLITSPQGHFLLDGGFADTAPQIETNIKKLGFRPEDVKFLLNSQAHYDHAGGLAELKRQTGAKMIASRGDSLLLENGGRNDFHFGDTLPFEPVKVDRIIGDGEKLRLGGVSLKAVLTPGHTPGCTSWLLTVGENGRKYAVIFVGSTTIPGYRLVGNEKYPGIVGDYEKTFRVMKRLRPDVFLAAHGSFFHFLEKAEKLRSGERSNPFIDPEGYRSFIERTEQQFRERIKLQQAEGPY